MELKLYDLGLVDYLPAYEFQKKILSDIKNGFLCSALVVCRHNPVITLGRTADRNNILSLRGAEGDEAISIPIVETERGGDVTYHGPGQLIVYPIFNLALLKKDIHWFLRFLEGVIIDFLLDFGISSERVPGKTGVWIKGKKIASIGISIRNWITFHGLSLNVLENDLANFGTIRPCGMDIEMASMEGVLGHRIEIEEVKQCLISKFQEVCYGCDLTCFDRRR
ncbi:MAG: lipoyl(octanoyl) transferase LipB [Candidatus Omnitrophica bacterium]|nr:lipoyl(octanoyl) transferase LipB [Candidatus Omnitrophota bacterium]